MSSGVVVFYTQVCTYSGTEIKFGSLSSTCCAGTADASFDMKYHRSWYPSGTLANCVDPECDVKIPTFEHFC